MCCCKSFECALETFDIYISGCEETADDVKSKEADKDDIKEALVKVTLKVFKMISKPTGVR